MGDEIKISVVVPTCNRKSSLLRLLESLNRSAYPFLEVIVVESGEQFLGSDIIANFKAIRIQIIKSVRSVCIQRNIGIRHAKGSWIFLCDDDLDVPSEYVKMLIDHARLYPTAGAISGVLLQKENGQWTSQYKVVSATSLIWRFIFQLSIWGEINIKRNNFLVSSIKSFYIKKGNHLSKAGWPVITNFSGDFFTTPLYGLGASVIRKDWLMNSLYDEVLDPHGIGDNFGVAVGFPMEGIHVVKKAKVYHHQENENRLAQPLQYYRRALALDYFFKVKDQIMSLKYGWFLWSLFGNWLGFVLARKGVMARAASKAWWVVITRKNPYVLGAKNGKKIIEPTL